MVLMVMRAQAYEIGSFGVDDVVVVEDVLGGVH